MDNNVTAYYIKLKPYVEIYTSHLNEESFILNSDHIAWDGPDSKDISFYFEMKIYCDGFYKFVEQSFTMSSYKYVTVHPNTSANWYVIDEWIETKYTELEYKFLLLNGRI